MTAAALLEKLLAARVRYGDKLDTIPVVVATGNKMDPYYETRVDVAAVKTLLDEKCFYIGHDHDG